MSLHGDILPLLAARAGTDPDAARLLEMFTKADETLRERSREPSYDGLLALEKDLR